MGKQDRKSILTSQQQQVLNKVATSDIAKYFYLSGGTALCEFYIPYRLSDDLDFFSEQEVSISSLVTSFKKWKDELGYESLDLNTNLNRNLVFMRFPGNYTLKTEFTYYPFTRLAKAEKYQQLEVDSILDIAVNKLFTIYQSPRSRDFMDLYMIIQKENYTIQELLMKAKLKFDWHVDPLQLGSQLLKARRLVDYPKLLEDLPVNWFELFEKEASKLGRTEVISSIS